jgi:coenzyme Q-binding protein COQ10
MAGSATTRHFSRVYPQFRPQDLYALASDIESYPAYVPLCRRTRIIARRDRELTVENVFGLGPIGEKFVSEARLDPPHNLIICSRDGLWRRFLLNWRFDPAGKGCRLSFDLTFEFASAFLNRLAPFAAPEFERRVLRAFERRAESLFGAGPRRTSEASDDIGR